VWKRPTGRALAMQAVLVAASAMAITANAEIASPQAFVDGIYKHYLGQDSKGLALSSEADIRRYFAQPLADAIVKDCEVIRRELAGPDHKWSVLGQSYGGFCAVQYLSAHPEGLREAFIAGGLPPLTASADDYYRATYPVVRSKTRKFFARYPRDEALAAQIMEHLHARDVRLPTGGRLTVRRFQQSGFLLGFDEGMEALHYLLELAFCEGVRGAELSLPFLRDFENSQPFETHPIFAVLHEMCYTQQAASRWSAHRIREEFPETNWAPGRPPAFTGEMIYPWMFDEYESLVPLREVAQVLAEQTSWPALYDPARSPLAILERLTGRSLVAAQ